MSALWCRGCGKDFALGETVVWVSVSKQPYDEENLLFDARTGVMAYNVTTMFSRSLCEDCSHYSAKLQSAVADYLEPVKSTPRLERGTPGLDPTKAEVH